MHMDIYMVLQSLRQLVHAHELAAEALYNYSHIMNQLQAAGLCCSTLYTMPEGHFALQQCFDEQLATLHPDAP